MRPLPLLAGVLTAAALAGCGVSAGVLVSHHDLTLPHATCGTVITHLLGPDTQLISASRGAPGCFDAAVRGCRAASIHVTEMGVDAGTQYVFVINPGGRPCQVAAFSQSYSANFGGHESQVTTTRCSVAAVGTESVIVSCGGQKLKIPATAGPV